VHFQRLRILHEGVIGLADRRDPSGPAVQNLPLQHELLEQHHGRITQQPQLQLPRRALRRQRFGKAAGIAIDALQLGGDIAFAIVQEQGIEAHHATDPTIRRGVDRVTHVHAVHTPVEQTQMMVVLAERMLPAPEHALASRQFETGRCRLNQGGLDARRGTRSQGLVRIEQQHPVMRGQIEGALLLRSVTLERLDDDSRAVLRRDLHRRVVAAGIQHQHLVRESQRGQARVQRRRVVVGRHHGGQRRAGHRLGSRGGRVCAIQTSSSQK